MGDNFGVNDNYLYHEVHFDSLDNSGGFTTTYSALDWPRFMLELPLDDISAVKILEVQVPFSYYVVTIKNQNFQLQESTGVQTTVTLPVGNYNSTTLIAALGAALSTASANHYTYTVTYNPATQAMTITSSNPSTFTLTFGQTTGHGNDNPRLFIGFPGGSTASASNGVLVTPNSILITGPNYLYLNSTTLGNDIKMYLPSGAVGLASGGTGPQICKIPVNCLPGSDIFWQDPDPLKWFSLDGKNNLPFIDFYFTVGNLPEVVAFNGLSFSLKIGVLQRGNDDQSTLVVGESNGSRMKVTKMTPRKRKKQ